MLSVWVATPKRRAGRPTREVAKIEERQAGIGVRELIADGKRVFLDYKYYDIAETLKKAVAQAAKLGVFFLTIHGSSSLIRGAVAGKGTSNLKLFTVTVLTAMDTGVNSPRRTSSPNSSASTTTRGSSRTTRAVSVRCWTPTSHRCATTCAASSRSRT